MKTTTTTSASVSNSTTSASATSAATTTFRTPRTTFRTPRTTFRIPHSAFRIPPLAPLAALLLLALQPFSPLALSLTIPFNQGWLFGGTFTPAATAPGYDDSAFERVTLPHTVVKLSWQKWDPALWQHEWIYRRHFTLPDNFKKPGTRVFIRLDGVMVGVTPTINGHRLLTHLGGYLPARYELTDFLTDGDNLLALEVDSRWTNVPPQGDPRKKTASIDYLEPGGIHRPVWLEAVPPVYIADVFAKPLSVLDPATRHVDIAVTLDTTVGNKKGTITAELRDGPRVLARATQPLTIVEKMSPPPSPKLTLANIPGIQLWSPETPKLYTIATTLKIPGQPDHTTTTRIGFREARFEVDGFYLNGKRYPIFGLNRHGLYPYTGYAMPPRADRHDAEILKHDLNCNFVRCSHYPQSDTFLDACDELGLLVWEEPPGWQYIGDAPWRQLFLRDIHDMIVRDRNRPSIVIWGTRINESRNEVDLYKKSRALAKTLDPTRPSSGSMTPETRRNWQQTWDEDVFAFDDYHAEKPGTVGILDPVKNHPYLLAEAVGQFNYAKGKNFNGYYRRAGDIATQQNQAIYHAQAHDKAAAKPSMAGVVAWCAFDYGSLVNAYDTVKTPGVIDTFRIPKLGATFYQAQCDPATRPIIAPSFNWDLGPATPRGPGKHAAIFSNCDRLEITIDNQKTATLHPDTKNYPNLKHPPFFADLDLDPAAAAAKPGLKIEGYLNDKLILTRRYSSDPAQDQLLLAADDPEITADGSDATRVQFQVADKYGSPRAYATGEVTLTLTGPATIIGDTPFDLAPSGGVGAIWLRSRPGAPGPITLTARHPTLGQRQVTITATLAH